MSPRRYLLVGLGAIYLVAAVFAIRWQLREQQWDAALEPYVAFVETERGLEFDHPVDVRWADIAAELAADFAADRNDRGSSTRDPYQRAYAILGLIEPNPDTTLAERVDDTTTEQAGAFYDPVLEEIVLPIDVDPAALGFTIVHELTHALQHQNGMLDLYLETPDAMATRTALIEGDADRVAFAWFEQLSESEQETLVAAAGWEASSADDPENSFLAVSFEASYVLGLPMVESIVEAHGQREIDRILRAADAGTSERLVDPLTDSPTSSLVLDPPADLDHPDGDLGAVTWFRALAPNVGTEAALRAVIGFDDDAFALLEESDDTCVWFGLAFDSEADSDEFIDVLGGVPGLAAQHLDEANGRVVEFQLCETFGDPNDQRFGTIVPLLVLQEMTRTHLEDGRESDVARCAAIAQAATIPADQPLEEFIGWAEVDARSSQYVDECAQAVFSRDGGAD